MDHLLRIISLGLAVLLSACTTMGTPDPVAREQLDFGEAETINICLYVDEGISEAEARKLIADAWRTEAPLYGIELNVVKVERWSRPAFQMDGILADLRDRPLEPPCDRVMAFVGRNLGDALWGFFAPEVLGAVNDETLTHGYTVARRATLNQLIEPPIAITRHEIYHLLGCGEHGNMPRCYKQIAMLKQWKRSNQTEIFPAWDLINNRVLDTRAAVNERLAEVADGAVAARRPLDPQGSLSGDRHH